MGVNPKGLFWQEIILNLKQIRFKRQIDEVDNESVSISISGQDKITAGDFQKFISGFQILNTDLVLCNLDPKVNISMELTIEKGRGYVPSFEEHIESVNKILEEIHAFDKPTLMVFNKIDAYTPRRDNTKFLDEKSAFCIGIGANPMC